MLNSDKLCNSFHALGTNECLDFSFFLLAACDSVGWPCKMWPKNCDWPRRTSLFGGEAQLAGIPERTARLSVGVGRRHSMTKDNRKSMSREGVA